LAPYSGGKPATRTVSGVHVSELSDPTPYLAGGELLLTTGMPFRDQASGAEDYVLRLLEKGISALGLGLGAGMDDVPTELAEACQRRGLELLIVPSGTPFLKVSAAYWDLAGRESQADLALSLTKQVSIAQAAAHPQAISAIVRTLAEAVNGWAAYLPTESGQHFCWPPETMTLLPRVRSEASRHHHTGTYSSGSFLLDDTTVVAFSINAGRRTVGFLAVGAGRPLRSHDRQLILSGCSMLSLIAAQERQLASAASQLGAAVTDLLLLGHVEAARTLAHYPGVAPIPAMVRLLTLHSVDLDPFDEVALLEAVTGLIPSSTVRGLRKAVMNSALRCRQADLVQIILDATLLTEPEPDASLPEDSASAAIDSPGRRASIGAALGLTVSSTTLHLHVPRIVQSAQRASAGQLEVVGSPPPDTVTEWVAALASYTKADLLLTVRAYLAHRGQWDHAATALGIHRNTLRYRITIAARLIDNDLDNPDVAAPLWLTLREYSPSANA
jgi:purine catabolism regulator